ncbi:hypothetical protein [Virgibacillus salexigens]|uniref:hypothetical protein n=1 Tax=Virgibacillus salexigens TaxID=61016 RepID=UPI00308168E4
MGDLTVTPDKTVNEIISEPSAVLLLPGADTWKLEKLFLNPRNQIKNRKKIVPIYSKKEVHNADNYVMVFATVRDRKTTC